MKKRKAFLDLLLEALHDGVKLTEEELRNEVATFIFAVRNFSFIDIFVNCNWVNTRWQWYSTHNQYIGQHK